MPCIIQDVPTSLPAHELLVEGDACLNLEEGGGLVGSIDGVEFQLSGDGAAPAAVGLGVGVGVVEGGVLAGDLVLEPDPIVVEDALPLLPVRALHLEVYLLVQAVPLDAVHHRQQLGRQSELRLLHPQGVPDDCARNSNGVPAEDGVLHCLGRRLVLLAQLPVGPKVVHSKTSDRHHSSPAEEDVVAMQSRWGWVYMWLLKGLMIRTTLPQVTPTSLPNCSMEEAKAATSSRETNCAQLIRVNYNIIGMKEGGMVSLGQFGCQLLYKELLDLDDLGVGQRPEGRTAFFLTPLLLQDLAWLYAHLYQHCLQLTVRLPTLPLRPFPQLLPLRLPITVLLLDPLADELLRVRGGIGLVGVGAFADPAVVGVGGLQELDPLLDFGFFLLDEEEDVVELLAALGQKYSMFLLAMVLFIFCILAQLRLNISSLSPRGHSAFQTELEWCISSVECVRPRWQAAPALMELCRVLMEGCFEKVTPSRILFLVGLCLLGLWRARWLTNTLVGSLLSCFIYQSGLQVDG